MILKFEDDIYASGPSYEYIESNKIYRIRLKRKRIHIYIVGRNGYIFVGRTNHNMGELRKISTEIEV